MEPSISDVQAKKRRTHHLPPLFLLMFLAPTIAELLLGDIALNSSFLFLFLLDLSYYGTGAILIREIVRRRGLPWVWVPILAFAYGLIEEGLVLHSLFNPNFPGIAGMGSYGRAMGVNWVWGMYVLGLHTMWSISVPILITELLFLRARRVRWIGNVGLSVIAVLFVLGLTEVANIYSIYITPDFTPPLPTLLIPALLSGLIGGLALFLPYKGKDLAPEDVSTQGRVPAPWIVGLFTFGLGGAFLFLHETFQVLPVLPPAIVVILIYLVLIVCAIIVLIRWSTQGQSWTDLHRAALACGAILDYCALGFLVSNPDPLNQAFHGFLVVLTIGLLILLLLHVHKRVRNQVQSSDQDGGDLPETAT